MEGPFSTNSKSPSEDSLAGSSAKPTNPATIVRNKKPRADDAPRRSFDSLWHKNANSKLKMWATSFNFQAFSLDGGEQATGTFLGESAPATPVALSSRVLEQQRSSKR